MAVPVTRNNGGQMFNGDTWRFDFYTYTGNQLAIWGTDFSVSSTSGTPYAGDIGLGLYGNVTGITGELYALFTSQVQCLGMRVWERQIGGVAPAGRAGVIDDGSTGTNVATTMLPLEVTGVLTTYSSFPGRKFRGRTYTPFIPSQAATASGQISNTYWGHLEDFKNAWYVGATIVGITGSATLTPVIYHKATHNSSFIINTVTQRKFGVQHKRGDYGRTNAPYIPN